MTPVAYDPCRPIHYVLRPDGAPAGGEEVVRAASPGCREVTGLQFVDDGTTDETSTRDRPIFQPDRYGDRWAPVLIAWETEEQNPALAGDTVGEAGSVAVSLGDGAAGLRRPAPSRSTPGGCRRSSPCGTATRPRGPSSCTSWATWSAWRTWTTRISSCTPRPGGDVADFAAGDLTGLAALGRGRVRPGALTGASVPRG